MNCPQEQIGLFQGVLMGAATTALVLIALRLGEIAIYLKHIASGSEPHRRQ